MINVKMSVAMACAAALSAGTCLASAPYTQPAALLAQVDTAYGNLHHLETDGVLSADFDVAGQQSHPVIHFTSKFAEPNKFRHDAQPDVLLGSTGQKVYAYEPARHVYLLDTAPAGRVDASQWPAAVSHILLEQNPSMLLALTGKSGDALKDLAGTMRLVPAVQIDKQSYPAFAFEVPGDKRGVTMVLDPATHLLRQVTFDMKPAMEARGATDVKRATVTIDYDRTVADGPAFAPTAFDWTPPAGSAPAPSNTAPPVQSDGDDAAMALVGKPASDFSLKDLDGKTVKLSEQKGVVVVLDFWATWCGPCVGSLPHLDALYNEKKADGLKVFAIDLQEEHDDVKSFVEAKKWTLPILLDTTGDTAKAYQAAGIPETVVVGKDGVITKVFVGAGPDTEAQLKAAVEKAMKG